MTYQLSLYAVLAVDVCLRRLTFYGCYLQGLKVENLSFFYPKETVFNSINFDVNLGETVAVFWGNGFGKSTLLMLLSGRYNYNQEIFFGMINV